MDRRTLVERALPNSLAIEPLLARIAGGDERALAELYDRTSPYVFGLVRRMLGEATEAEEVTQDVYVQAWRTAGTFDPARGSGWAWLALLARSRAIDRLRARRSYRAALEELEREPEMLGSSPGDPAAEAAWGDARRLVRGAMAELPPEQRAALELAFFGGLSHREIAERTGTPLGTIKTRIRTALSRLERSLGPSLGE